MKGKWKVRDYKNIICALIIAAAIIVAALIIRDTIQSAATDIVHGMINAVNGL